MRKVRVGGRKYSDPDIVSLIGATGRLVDPRSAVVTQARRLNAQYRQLGGDRQDPWERILILASICGLEVKTMDVGRLHEDRDAVLITTEGKRGQILYNPRRPKPRVMFSIAHEISHTFFPNSTQGARFRTLCDPSSQEANELERLCDLGASEILMPEDEFRSAVGGRYSLDEVTRLSDGFGTSFEATVFRLATAHPHLAAAGLARYRCRKAEGSTTKRQESLFGKDDTVPHVLELRYRRQSFFLSAGGSTTNLVPWNKSFPTESCIYRAGTTSRVEQGYEILPCIEPQAGLMQAVRAPYQRPEAHPEFCDVLFVWTGK